MTLFGENYNSTEFMLGLITRAEHCALSKGPFKIHARLREIYSVS